VTGCVSFVRSAGSFASRASERASERRVRDCARLIGGTPYSVHIETRGGKPRPAAPIIIRHPTSDHHLLSPNKPPPRACLHALRRCLLPAEVHSSVRNDSVSSALVPCFSHTKRDQREVAVRLRLRVLSKRPPPAHAAVGRR
jgi:hypothetical protein